MMLRSVSIATAFSFFLLSSTALPVLAGPLSEEFAEELQRPNSPIHIVYQNGKEELAVNHKKIIGAEDLHRQGITGREIKVIVIEAIFDPYHLDYAGNLSESTLDATNASEGFWYDWVVRPRLINLFGDHGAHVTGTIAGKNGVAPNASLRAIDYAKEAWVPHEDHTIAAGKSLLKALEIAAKTKGDIVNLSQALVHKSLHSTHAISDETVEALIKIVNSDKIIVMAAGNEGIALGDDVYTRSLVAAAADPRMKGRLLLVGAMDYPQLKEGLEKHSNRAGNAKNFYMVAPGADIDGPNSYNRRINLTGTSQATPLVTGILALIMEAAPGLTPEEYVRYITRSARQQSLTGSTLFPSDIYGHGALDAKAAIDLVRKEGKYVQPNPAKYKETQETSTRVAPKAGPSSFVEKTKFVLSSAGNAIYSAVKSVGTAIKAGISSCFGWIK